MKASLLRPPARALLCALAAFLALAPRADALERADWKTQQSLPIERAGVVRLALPPATLDAATPALNDLRVLDGNGREVPYLVEVSAPARPAASLAPKAFRTTLTDTGTEVLIETGSTAPIASVVLASPAPAFLKAARLKVSDDGDNWRVLRTGIPLFRQFGAEQLTLDLGLVAARIRIVIDDTRSRPVPFTAATLLPARVITPPPSLPVPGARLSHREEFGHETVLTIDLGARNIPLAALEFAATDPIFTRKVVIAVRELRNEAAVERIVGSGTIFRLSADGLPPAMGLTVPVTASVPSRELIVQIDNGDSPPLALDSISVRQRPVWLLFSAAAPGTYTLLTGNPAATAPRYDLSQFSTALRDTAPARVTVGGIEPNPLFVPRAPAPLASPRGGAIDPAAWRYRKPVQLVDHGVQQLELDPAVLGGSQSSLADLRLVRDDTQVPYLLERPALARVLRLTPTVAPAGHRASTSRWHVSLSAAALPVSRLILSSPTPLFLRHVRVYEVVTDERAGEYEHALAAGEWNKVPGTDQRLTLALSGRPASNTLTIETDNGDNPPIELGPVEVSYPVVRLLFKADAGPLDLLYGNRDAAAPRYDIALIADQLIASERHPASLGAEDRRAASRWAGLATSRSGILFWSALSLVVIVLLVVVAKALPKPPAPGT